MKKILTFTTLFVISGLMVAYAQKAKVIKAKSSIFKTLYLRDGFYIDETETTVEDWAYFVGYKLHTEGGDSARAMMPDLRLLAPQSYQLMQNIAEICKSADGEAVNLATNNLGEVMMLMKIIEAVNKAKEARLPGTEFPITGISYRQAKVFCEWRTANINELLSSGSKKIQKLGIKQVKFRLPTPQEADTVLGFAQDPTQDGIIDSVFIAKGCRLWNYFRAVGCDADAELVTTYGRAAMMRVMTYNPSVHGVYDLLGNVAEMTTEPFICKGGSFKNPAQDGLSGSYIRYDSPQQWIGFRCVAEYIFEEKKK